MKNYDEITNDLLKRRDKYVTEQRKKRKRMIGVVSSFCCVCLVALLGFGMWQGGLFESMLPDEMIGENSDLQDKDKTDNDATVSTPDLPVIWGNYNDESQDMGFGEWNGKNVTSSLSDVLSDEKNKNSLIAIGVGFDFDQQFVYNGKSISEYATEADNERLLYNKLVSLLKMGDKLKYGEALYTTGGPDGIKWAKELYEKTVADIGESLLAKYIVNGEFLKEKLEADIASFDEGNFPCRIAYEVACDAYYQSVINAAIKQLEIQNINYENQNNRLVIFATADKFSAVKIDSVLFYSLAFKDSEGMDDIA